MFAKHDVPHAKGRIFINPWTAHRFAQEHGFPLCIKPNVSGFSRGSHFPITNYRELWKAALLVKVWWPASVIEQYLLGANYRVLATQNELVSVIRRYPPFVDGNGSDSIATLIDAENAVREKMGLYPTIHPVEKSPRVAAYLRKQGLDYDSVPADGQRVYTFNRVELAPYRQQRCIFLEVNSRPYTRMHANPRYGDAENLEAFYAEMDAMAITDTDTF